MTINKIRRNYQLLGLENDLNCPLIWLIHGAGGDLNHYNSVAQLLVKNGFRILLMDVRYHGLSQPTICDEEEKKRWFSFDNVMEDMNIILEEVKERYYPADNKLHLFLGGLSMGGMISLLYAANWQKKKKFNIQLEGLILLASGIPYMQIPRVGWDLYAERKATLEDLQRTRIAITLSSLTQQAEVKRALQLISDDALYEVMVTIATLLPSSPQELPYTLLTKKPTLIIVPDQDPYTRPELELLHKINLEQGVDSELAVVENSGHMIILDQPKKVADTIQKFCNRILFS
ncbi:Alpha/Beta hydrolase protein [Cokeromyces recurvatus]|uniref:Alpha/Beta hydrolase protein n=1 Tax=Cokeromyces recurvatus TaxID=90255 RepID=UPI0022205561|nr:Alpha/Beta hydrolase protein [Cokeromyces recurvatus]KAI7904467.1 Alpha/Beta hydrolase protein [Cokeromyces recurvatus]